MIKGRGRVHFPPFFDQPLNPLIIYRLPGQFTHRTSEGIY